MSETTGRMANQMQSFNALLHPFSYRPTGQVILRNCQHYRQSCTHVAVARRKSRSPKRLRKPLEMTRLALDFPASVPVDCCFGGACQYEATFQIKLQAKSYCSFAASPVS